MKRSALWEHPEHWRNPTEGHGMTGVLVAEVMDRAEECSLGIQHIVDEEGER